MASGAARRMAGRSGAVALLALLAGLTVAPRAADAAGCAHPGATAGAAHLDGLAAIGALADADAQDRSRPLPVSPCAGLRCSTGDPFAPAPTAPPLGARAESWGLPPVPTPTAGMDGSSFLADEPAARPRRLAATLLRPPR
jgi:hypothetical protein